MTAIHHTARIGTDLAVGEGTVIMAGAVINCGTKIGTHCIVNTGATLDHDNKISDFVHISPGVHLAGAVSVGEKSWIGVGSCCPPPWRRRVPPGAPTPPPPPPHRPGPATYRNWRSYSKRDLCRNAGKETEEVNRLDHVLRITEVFARNVPVIR